PRKMPMIWSAGNSSTDADMCAPSLISPPARVSRGQCEFVQQASALAKRVANCIVDRVLENHHVEIDKRGVLMRPLEALRVERHGEPFVRIREQVADDRWCLVDLRLEDVDGPNRIARPGAELHEVHPA